MVCAFYHFLIVHFTIFLNLKRKNCTWYTSGRNLPVSESRFYHSLVVWPWTSHVTSQYWSLESGENTWGTPTWAAELLTERINVALNRRKSDKEQLSPHHSWVIPGRKEMNLLNHANFFPHGSWFKDFHKFLCCQISKCQTEPSGYHQGMKIFTSLRWLTGT